jgi:hypothetical protein
MEDSVEGKAQFIQDPEVRKIFEAGEKSGKLEFLYGTKPASTLYYVFIWRDEHGDPHDGKMTKMQLVGEYGGTK